MCSYGVNGQNFATIKLAVETVYKNKAFKGDVTYLIKRLADSKIAQIETSLCSGNAEFKLCSYSLANDQEKQNFTGNYFKFERSHSTKLIEDELKDFAEFARKDSHGCVIYKLKAGIWEKLKPLQVTYREVSNISPIANQNIVHSTQRISELEKNCSKCCVQIEKTDINQIMLETGFIDLEALCIECSKNKRQKTQ